MSVPGIYRHYKGPLYRVLFTALESTNGRNRAPAVVYVSMEKGSINVRDEEEFHGSLITEDGVTTPRFVYVGDGIREQISPAPRPPRES